MFSKSNDKFQKKLSNGIDKNARKKYNIVKVKDIRRD